MSERQPSLDPCEHSGGNPACTYCLRARLDALAGKLAAIKASNTSILIRTVVEMRKSQREYFRHRRDVDKRTAIQLERRVDQMLDLILHPGLFG